MQTISCDNFHSAIADIEDTDNIVFYHLTHSDRLDSILSEGLKPNCGHHCKILLDKTEPIIFISKKDDVKFWESCLPDCDVMLRLDCTDVRSSLRRRYYVRHGHGEYGCLVDISADHITHVFQKSNVISTDAVAQHYRRYIR